MNQRLHDHLDGTLAADALDADTLAGASRLERAAAHLRAVAAPAGLAERVMAALPPHAPGVDAAGRARSAWRWLWAPRAVRLSLRPAYALGAAAAAALAFALLPAGPREPVGPVRSLASAPTQVSRVYVQFRLDAPGAEDVALAGTFTGWEPRYPLHESEPGVWTALVPMEPGVHDYAFVVDGDTWVADPSAPQVDDSFGGKNSRISLPPLALRI